MMITTLGILHEDRCGWSVGPITADLSMKKTSLKTDLNALVVAIIIVFFLH